MWVVLGRPSLSLPIRALMEKFSLLIQRKVARKEWKLIRVTPKDPAIWHLLFTDDVILFFLASVNQARVIRHTLIEFCGCFGMMVNVAKSKAYAFPLLPNGRKVRIKRLLEMPFTTNLGRYLGIPLYKGRIFKTTFKYILERIGLKLMA